MLLYSVFSFLLFCCLESTVRMDIWMWTTFVNIMVIFWKCYSESYLITAIFKVLSQQLWGTLTTAVWNTHYNWRFYESTYALILSSRLEKASWNENRRSCLESCELHKNWAYTSCLPFWLSFVISLILKFIQCFYRFLNKNH